MGLHLYSIHHGDHGLAAVEQVAPAVPGLAMRLIESSPDVRGVVVLSTCNRLEVYVDVDAGAHPGVAIQVREAIAAGQCDVAAAEVPLRVRHASEVLWHLFEVGAGLDSLVVGEREVAGQLRRALKSARAEGTATYLLTESIEQALRTSRRVAHLTGLAANGRSVVGVALDLLRRDWPSTRVLLLGTGSYAGAVVSALAARGSRSVAVHSPSGRAPGFAASHAVGVAEDLADALAGSDVVISCRGVGTPVLTVDVVSQALVAREGRSLDIVDLALARDAEPDVGRLPGVRLVDLAAIQRHVPEASAREVARAEDLVARGVADLLTRLKGRQLDSAIVALRDTVSSMVDDEIERLPSGRPVTGAEAAHALRRLAARLMHEPSVRVRQAAEEGRGDVALAALSELYGLEIEAPAPSSVPTPRPVVDPDPLDTAAGA